MDEVTVIGIDLVKRNLQVHGAKADTSVAYGAKLLGACAGATSKRGRGHG